MHNLSHSRVSPSIQVMAKGIIKQSGTSILDLDQESGKFPSPAVLSLSCEAMQLWQTHRLLPCAVQGSPYPCSLGCGKSLSFLFCLYSFLAQICTNPCTSCLYSNTVFLGLQCSSETLSGGLFLETQPKFSLLMQCRTGLETGLSSKTVSLMHLFENKFIPIGGLEFHYG